MGAGASIEDVNAENERETCDKLFRRIDANGDNKIEVFELCSFLFPKKTDYPRKTWVEASEEKSTMKRTLDGLQQLQACVKNPDPALKVTITRLKADLAKIEQDHQEQIRGGADDSRRQSSKWKAWQLEKDYDEHFEKMLDQQNESCASYEVP